jgi:multidrug efflux pump subunit AcrB
MAIAEFFMRNRVISWMLILVLLLGGWASYSGLPRLEDPAFTLKDALVITRYPGASPAQVEQEVTYPLENAIQQLAYVDKIRSISSTGLSQITVTMKKIYGPDRLPQIWDELRRKVGDLQGKLPPGVMTPWVNDDFGDVFGLLIAVFGDGYSYEDIKDYVDFLRRELILVDGVGKITVAGQQAEKVFIEISQAKLGRLGIPPDRLLQILQTQNSVSNAGTIRVGTESIRFHPTGEFQDVSELEDLIISEPGDQKLIYLRDVATVSKGYQEIPTNVYTQDGRLALMLGVSFGAGSNVVDVGERINRRLAELEFARPWGIETAVVYNQPGQVVSAVNNFLISLIEAVAIVIVVLMIFMGLRTGLLVGLVLLITIMGSFIFISMKGLDLQRISLGALIIALGMLVDNAIVVVEGILMGMKDGLSKIEAANAIVKQTMWPLLGATVIAIIAFAPIGLSKDATGEIVGSLFWVLLFSLFLSWFTAISVTPFLAELMLKAPEPAEEETRDPYSGFIFRVFKRLLDAAMRFRWLTLALMVVLLFLSIKGFGFVRNEFFPPMSTPMFLIDYWGAEGTDIRETLRNVTRIDQDLRKNEEVDQITTTVGRGAIRFLLPYKPEKAYPSYAQFLVRTKDIEDVGSMIRKASVYFAENHPQAQINFKRLMVGPQPDGKIEARVAGPDPEELRRISSRIKAIFRQEEAALAVRDDWRQRTKVIRPQFSETQARRVGIDKAKIDEALLVQFSGKPIGLYRDGTELLPIILRPPERERYNIDSAHRIKIWSPVSRSFIPIDQVISGLTVEWEDPLIMRYNRKRTLTVMMDPNPLMGKTVAVMLAGVKSQVESLELPSGYTLEWGGEFEKARDAKANVFATLPLGFLVMFIITVLLFNSLKNALIVWLTVPLAIIGVTIGLLGGAKPFSFMALLGILSLSGMLIKNGIVLMDQIKVELENGREPYHAVFVSAVSRVRPVAMAALTTILGMIPLLPDMFFQSMAVTIMGGLGFSTVLTLLVVPVLYITLHRIGYRSPSAMQPDSTPKSAIR